MWVVGRSAVFLFFFSECVYLLLLLRIYIQQENKIRDVRLNKVPVRNMLFNLRWLQRDCQITLICFFSLNVFSFEDSDNLKFK